MKQSKLRGSVWPGIDRTVTERIRKKLSIVSDEPFKETILNYRKSKGLISARSRFSLLLNSERELVHFLAIERELA